MKALNVDTLESRAAIDEVVIRSVHSMLYTVRVLKDGSYYMVHDNRHQSYTAKNIAQVKRDFSKFEVKRFSLFHESAYDEMIGLPENASKNALYIRQGNNVNPHEPLSKT